jgi:integrase
MAVVTRKRKSGAVYFAVREWQGRQVSERVGSSKREAEIRDRAMAKEIKAGTYQPPEHRKSSTVAEYAVAWGSIRKNASAVDERALLRLYVLSRPWLAGRRLDEVRPADVDRWVTELKAETKPDGSRRLTDKTIANAVGALRQMFAQAFREDRCLRQPVTLAPGTLKRSRTEEPETYTPAEVLVLTRHHAIPWPIRVLNALCLFTGMREGEACGRRWRDLSETAGSLPAVAIRDQYNGRPLKTERPRLAPIHPELQAVLEAWAAEGFELLTGRKPEPDDFIVPNVSKWATKPCHTKSSYYKAFVRFAEAAGVRPRTLHSTRHTFISLCRRGGARKDVLERVTHNARGDIVDRYTHLDWEPLCEAVLCLHLDARPTLQRGIGSGGDSGGDPPALEGTSPQKHHGFLSLSRVRFPAPPLSIQQKTSGAEKPRQAERQESELLLADLRAAGRRRKQLLLALAQHDPEAAAPGLAICKASDAVLAGDTEGAVAALRSAATGGDR